MREIVLILVVSEVGDEFIQVARVALERTTRREVNIANDLVDADSSRNIAAFVSLIPQFVCPALISALFTKRQTKNNSNDDA